jgi:hypothetical protein
MRVGVSKEMQVLARYICTFEIQCYVCHGGRYVFCTVADTAFILEVGPESSDAIPMRRGP